MLPLLPQITVVCLLIVIQYLILFIFQILTGSLLSLKIVSWLVDRLWYTVPFTSASLCCWIVFIHSLPQSSCQLAGGRTGLPVLGLHLCLAQAVADKSSPSSLAENPSGLSQGCEVDTRPLTTLPQPLLLRLILAL